MKTQNLFGKNSMVTALCLASLMLTSQVAWATKVEVVPWRSTIYTGAPPAFRIGALAFWTGEWTGEWTADSQYAIGDSVQHDGSSYICIQDHTASAALIPSDDPDNWSLMAARWVDGTDNVTATVDVGIGKGATTPATLCENLPLVLSATGEVWMACNLGATQVATAIDDEAAYGDYYQWGRLTDGHEKLSSAIYSLSSSDDPGHDDFITGTTSPYDWRSSRNDSLWQGADGTNNPCPSGFRLPADTEWQAEIDEYGATRKALFNSPLKLVAAGLRHYNDLYILMGSFGNYWSYTVNGTGASNLEFAIGYAGLVTKERANGFSVRCIQD